MKLQRMPWHYMPMVFITLTVYAFAVADYLLVKLGISAYLDLFTEEQVAFFTGMPLWASVTWGISVWVGAFGAVRMIGRRSGVAVFLGLSAIATIVLHGWIAIAARPSVFALLGVTGTLLLIAIATIIFLLWSYARAMHARGVLV